MDCDHQIVATQPYFVLANAWPQGPLPPTSTYIKHIQEWGYAGFEGPQHEWYSPANCALLLAVAGFEGAQHRRWWGRGADEEEYGPDERGDDPWGFGVMLDFREAAVDSDAGSVEDVRIAFWALYDAYHAHAADGW